MDHGYTQGYGTVKYSFFPDTGDSRGYRECFLPIRLLPKRVDSMSIVLAWVLLLG